MTIPCPGDDLASAPLLEQATTERSALELLWQAQNDQLPRGAAARVVGRSPLTTESRRRYLEALAEAEVAERLRGLSTPGESWRVLHSVPIGTAGVEIDHVVIGPAGVFTLLVAARTIEADARARHEAERASILLASALGEPVPVTPLVVAVGPARRDRSRQLDDVDVVPASRVDRFLRSQKPVYSVEEVREITRAALKPRTWDSRVLGDKPEEPAGSQPLPTQHELRFWFQRVRTEVDAARRTQALWAVAGVVVLLAVVLEIPTLTQGLLG